jgi:hypothetical protein
LTCQVSMNPNFRIMSDGWTNIAVIAMLDTLIWQPPCLFLSRGQLHSPGTQHATVPCRGNRVPVTQPLVFSRNGKLTGIPRYSRTNITVFAMLDTLVMMPRQEPQHY